MQFNNNFWAALAASVSTQEYHFGSDESSRPSLIENTETNTYAVEDKNLSYDVTLEHPCYDYLKVSGASDAKKAISSLSLDRESGEEEFIKLYREYKRLESAHNQDETNKAVRLCNMQWYLGTLLCGRKIEDKLTGQASLQNKKINFFLSALLGDTDDPLNIALPEEYLADPLFELVREYKEFTGSISRLSPKLIETFGVEFLKGKVTQSMESLVIDSKLFSQSRQMREMMLELFENKSASLNALIQTEDIFDPRIKAEEIGLVEFCYLDFLVDEESCDRAVDLSSHFIKSLWQISMVYLFCETLTSPLFIAHIIQALGHDEEELLKYQYGYVMLANREDSNEIYNLIHDVDEIIESIECDDDTYSAEKKIECGLFTDLDDDMLLPIISSAEDVKMELVMLAIKKKRSAELLQALKRAIPYNVAHTFVSGVFANGCIRSHYLRFDLAPVQIEALSKASIGSKTTWWRSLTSEASFVYAIHAFNAGYVFKDYRMNAISTDPLPGIFYKADEHMVEQIIRYAMRATCDDLSFLDDFGSEALLEKVREIVRKALKENAFPHKMLHVEYYDKKPLIGFHRLVLEEVLSLEGGFVTMLLGESGAIDITNMKSKCAATRLIKFVLKNPCRIEIGELADNQDFKDFLLTAVISSLTGISSQYIKLASPEDREKMRNIIASGSEKRRNDFKDLMSMSFPSRASEDYDEKLSMLSSFHRALYAVLQNEGWGHFLP